jgi:hypothetical protein
MKHRGFGFCVAALTVAACGDVASTRGIEDDVDALRDGMVDVDAAMCSNRRIVGRAPGAECPNPPSTSWAVTNVLEDGTTYLADHHADLPGPAGRYCVYQWTPATPPTGVTALKDSLLDEVQDCMAIAPMSPPPPDPVPLDAHPLNETIGGTLKLLFQDRAGIVEASELSNGTSTEDDRFDTTVTLVDTSPHTIPQGVNYDHGELLRKMIYELACPTSTNTDCAVQVERVLGLPRLALDQVDLVKGGKGGTLVDLAGGLMEAHQRWMASGHDTAHFINISAGWQDATFGNVGANISDSANAQAIHTALKYIACHGEIVIAAAGNGDEITCSEDAIFPAHWQNELAPTASECATMLGVTVANLPVPIPNVDRPLVYAVGGLTLGDPLAPAELLPNAPELGIPPLVAIADHAIGGVSSNDAMTGTSVAAVVTSAAAAMVASYTGGTGWDAMQAVYDGGVETDLEATITMPAGTTAVQRVDICGALLEACEPAGACAVDVSCTRGDYEVDLTELDTDYFASDWSPAQSYGATDNCGASESICGASTQAMAPGDAATTPAAQACAWNFSDPGALFVKPQPPKAPCPACTLTTEEKTLYFTLSDEFAAADVQNVTLHITKSDATEFSVNLGDPPVDSFSTKALLIDDRLFVSGIVVRRAVVEVQIRGSDETNDALVL